MMKRWIALVLSVLTVFVTVSCGSAKESMIVCPSCNETQAEGGAFCRDCGAKLNTKKICAACGHENDPNAKFCGECGASLSSVMGGTEYPLGTNGSENNPSADYSDDAYDYESTYTDPTGTDGASDTSGDGDQKGDSICSICAYNGYDACEGHECWVCDSKGWIKCYGCHGGYDAYGDCFACEGGKIDCTCEDGTVYYDRPLDIPYEESYELCDDCEAGYVVCPLCEGTGRYGSYEVGGFDGADGVEVEKLCYRCLGLKKEKCRTCGGDGRKPCT